jgi:hypothetical protein
MVDPGLGPIAGVPETGTPMPGSSTGYSVGVRPANLPEQPEQVQNYSPLSAAPEFIDGASGGGAFGGRQGGFSPAGGAPAPARNPLSTVSESDLVLPPGSVPPPAQGMFGANVNVGGAPAPEYDPYARGSGQYAQQPPLYPELGAPASLGQTVPNTPYSDLVGSPTIPLPQQPYGGQRQYNQQPYGQQPYGDYSQQQDYYQQPQNFPPPSSRPMPAPVGQRGGRGWTLTEDFR